MYDIVIAHADDIQRGMTVHSPLHLPLNVILKPRPVPLTHATYHVTQTCVTPQLRVCVCKCVVLSLHTYHLRPLLSTLQRENIFSDIYLLLKSIQILEIQQLLLIENYTYN